MVVPSFQSGFHAKRSCCKKVLALTSFIKAGFQKELKPVTGSQIYQFIRVLVNLFWYSISVLVNKM